MPWPSENFTGCAVSQDNQYSVQRQIENATQNDSGSSNGSSGSAGSTATTPAQKDCPNGAQIGEGVAIGVLALVALAMAGWAFYERRQKNRLLAGKGEQYQHHRQEQQQTQYYDAPKGPASPAPQYQSPQRPPVSEMDSFGNGSRPRAHEMQS